MREWKYKGISFYLSADKRNEETWYVNPRDIAGAKYIWKQFNDIYWANTIKDVKEFINYINK